MKFERRLLGFRLILLFAVMLSSWNGVFSQKKISPYLIGQNVWERNAVFNILQEVKAVKFQTIRIGGNGYENTRFTDAELVRLIDYVRSVGAEPIVQLPRQLKDGDKAFNVIARINGELGKAIKFWSIGNEPDHHNQLASPEEVFDYYTRIAAQIKRYDSNARIMGFDLASYKTSYIDRLLGGDLDLTGKVPGHRYYYLDMVSFHGYKFKDILKMEADVADLKLRLERANRKRPAREKLGWAITEFNSHWLVDYKLDGDYWPFTFYNGQMFAEVYDLGMREGAFTICPWSLLEGGADREGTDLSMFDLTNNRLYPRSNYYHTQMLAQNFRENYLPHRDNKDSVTVIPMGDSDGISVMILNKSKKSHFDYIVKLNDKKNISSGDTLYINISAGIVSTYRAGIQPESTQMLIFDNKGNLINKYSYSRKDEAERKAPTIERF